MTVDNLDELRKQLRALFEDAELSNDDRAALARVLTLATSVASASDGPTETGNSMSKSTRTVPAGKASLEDRLHKRLVAKGIKPAVARKMARRAAARVIRERITGPGTPAAAAMSSTGHAVIELAEIHQWKHGWVPLTPFAAAIKAKMAHGSSKGHSPDLPKALQKHAADIHGKHGRSVVHGSYGHSEVPAGHAARKAPVPKAAAPNLATKSGRRERSDMVHKAASELEGFKHGENVEVTLDGRKYPATVHGSSRRADGRIGSVESTRLDVKLKANGLSQTVTADAMADGRASIRRAGNTAKAAEVAPKKVTAESKRAAERKTLTKDERKAYNDAAAAAKVKYQPAERQHQIGMAAAREHTAAKAREADIAHYTPEQRAIYDRERSSRYGSSHHQAMRMVDVLMKERAAAQEKKAAEDAKKAKDFEDFKAGLGSKSTEELRNTAKTNSRIWPGVDDRKAKLAGAELQRRESARIAERLTAKPDQVIGGAGLHRINGAPHQYLVKQDGKALGIVTGHSKDKSGKLRPTYFDDKPTHYVATTVGRRKPGSDTSTMPKRNSEHGSLADAVAAVQTRGAKIPKESKADQASLFEAPKTGRSSKAPAMGEGELGGPIKFEGGRTGTVWADAPKGGKWVIPDERQPGEAHAIYVDKTGKVHEQLSSRQHQQQWLAARKAEVAASTPNARAAQEDKARKLRDAADRAKSTQEQDRRSLNEDQMRAYRVKYRQMTQGKNPSSEADAHVAAMTAARGAGATTPTPTQVTEPTKRFVPSASDVRSAKAKDEVYNAMDEANSKPGGLKNIPDGQLASMLQALEGGNSTAYSRRVADEIRSEMRRRGLKIPASAALSNAGGNVVELAKVPARLRAAARQEAADNDTALPDGSWPIRNKAELAKAIQSWGRAVASGRASTVKAWILKRAKALGVSQDVMDRINALEAAA